MEQFGKGMEGWKNPDDFLCLSWLQPCSFSTPSPTAGPEPGNASPFQISLLLLSSTVISGYSWPSLAFPPGVLFQQEPDVPGCTRGWLQLEDPQSCPKPP